MAFYVNGKSLIEMADEEHLGLASALRRRDTAVFASRASGSSPVGLVKQAVLDRVLHRLADGPASRNSWKLSRAVWRAGELRISQAEPLLLGLIGRGDAMLDYSIAWSLGQLGSEASIKALRAMEADAGRPDTVRRIAAVSLFQLLPIGERQTALEECYRALPEPLAELAQRGPAEQFAAALHEHLSGGDQQAFRVLDLLYLIDNNHVRPALLQQLRTAPLKPNYFQRIRHIFKAAELRRDAETFGLIAYRIETTGAMFRMPPPWRFQYSQRQKPTIGPAAEAAFSVQTREYLRRRIWRTLRRLGELGDPDYVRMAAAVLAPFTDEDAKPLRTTSRYDWEAYRRSGWRNAVTITTHYDRFAGYWAFNHILYGNSPRYAPDPGRRLFCCQPGYEPGAREPREREEAFPQLWEQHPETLLDLIAQSRCEAVHRFAVKVLRACPEFCRDMNLGFVLLLLQAPYEVTAELGFELAVQRYDPLKPDPELVLALANCAYERARRQAHQWISVQKSRLLKDPKFITSLVASRFADTRLFAREVLRQTPLSEQDAQAVIGRLMALLLSLGFDDAPLAADVSATLLAAFGPQLSRLGPEVIRDLLRHRLTELQQFAGNLLLSHETLSKEPPADVLQALLEAEHPAVREIGVRVLAQLPDAKLKANLELLIALTRHARADLREAIRPTVARLAREDREFGRRLAEVLLEALLTPGAPEGVPSHTARVLREDLRDCLDHVPAETVWRLLQSRSAPAQEIGGVLLPTNVRVEELSVSEIVKLANHEILSVREAAWRMCAENVDRLRADPEAAARLLDSKWEDSRQFGFRFFREHFAGNGVLPSDVLISICDSLRPDVQQFGRELVAEALQNGRGEEYVLKLSEHPSDSMQLFASDYLERHARDSVEQLRRLAPYFVSVLSRVNRGRKAKDRVFRFLESEALKSEAAAEAVGAILARQSATVAIGDKAASIEIMTKIHAAFPSVALPIHIRPVEVRGGV